MTPRNPHTPRQKNKVALTGSGTHTREAAFHLFFRRNPFGGGYAVACGPEDVVNFLRDFRFDEGDLSYLAALESQR